MRLGDFICKKITWLAGQALLIIYGFSNKWSNENAYMLKSWIKYINCFMAKS